LLLGGGWLALFPSESVNRVAANDHEGGDHSYILSLSKKECRTLGFVTAAFGLALGAFAVFPLKR
jgi:hypothetical protein